MNDWSTDASCAARQLTLLLIQKKFSIATMESCTSGLLVSLLTDTEGSSSVVKGGCVTYCNEAKVTFGVPKKVIDRYGVYSPETARKMARACREKLASDIGIGTTGSFGNVDPNNADSVPGSVDYAIAFADECTSRHLTLPSGLSRPDSKSFVAAEVFRTLAAMLA